MPMRKPCRVTCSRSKRHGVTAAWIATTAGLAAVAACGGQSSPVQTVRTVTTIPPTVTVTASEPSAPTESELTGSASQSRYISELDPLASSGGVYTGAAEINGRGFVRSVTLGANAAGPVSFAEYNLGRQWNRFFATVGLRDDSPTGGSLTFEIVVDGSKEYEKEVPLGETRVVDVEVKKALRMKVSITYAGQDAGNYYYGSWGNAMLK